MNNINKNNNLHKLQSLIVLTALQIIMNLCKFKTKDYLFFIIAIIILNSLSINTVSSFTNNEIFKLSIPNKLCLSIYLTIVYMTTKSLINMCIFITGLFITNCIENYLSHISDKTNITLKSIIFNWT